MSKVHIGSGTVYLRDYINVDLPTDFCHLASDRPDLVEKYITDDSDYYGRHEAKTVGDLRKGAVVQDYVCDRYGSFFFIPCSSNSVEEILARSVFEHLSLTEASRALAECHRVLTKDGVLRLDVPDHDETMRQFIATKDEFFIRHLLGPRKTRFGYHLASYTKDALRRFVDENGFVCIGEETNIHLYPQFCLRFTKA